VVLNNVCAGATGIGRGGGGVGGGGEGAMIKLNSTIGAVSVSSAAVTDGKPCSTMELVSCAMKLGPLTLLLIAAILTLPVLGAADVLVPSAASLAVVHDGLTSIFSVLPTIIETMTA